MPTLASATLDLARLVSYVYEGIATGGSATTLIDTNLSEVDDYFNGGTLWLLSGNNSGKTAIITDWTLTTHTFAFATLTALCASGDIYAAALSDFPRRQLRMAVNRALTNIGGVPTIYEDASFLTVANQAEYTLPVGVSDIKSVSIATLTTSPYDYYPHYGWKETANGKLVFDDGRIPPASDYRIRLLYRATPTILTTDTSTISSFINRERLAWKAAVILLRDRMNKIGREDPHIIDLMNEALRNELVMDNRYPIPDITRDPHLAGYGEVSL